jgi:hypothetical protein
MRKRRVREGEESREKDGMEKGDMRRGEEIGIR